MTFVEFMSTFLRPRSSKRYTEFHSFRIQVLSNEGFLYFGDVSVNMWYLLIMQMNNHTQSERK